METMNEARERVELLLLEGLDSGTPIAATAEYWEEKKRALIDRAARAIDGR